MRALAVAVSMFTVLPAPRQRQPAALASRALRWLPLVGAVLGGLAMLPALAVWRGGSTGAPLLAGVLVVTTLAVLTRGLHLDGLADLADGLGSGRSADGALEVMARSDIGPFGVGAVALSLLIEAASVSAILAAGPRPSGVVVVVSAVVTGRIAAVWAAGRGIRAARPGGFGALVAGSASWQARVLITSGGLAAALGCAWWAGSGWPGLVRLAGSCAGALVVAWVVRRHAVARLGGVTGDVFGALIEITFAAALVFYAGALAWR